MKVEFAAFTGSKPEIYDRCLGPRIFADYATDIATRAAARAPKRVLELAAGTGIVTRKLRDALPADAHLTATDLNEPMLEIAEGKFQAGEQVEFGPADACNLPFGNAMFDCIVCQFGVMFFPDKGLSYREAHRVLAPGGSYVFNVWDSLDTNPFAGIADGAFCDFFDADPPQFHKVPFQYHDRDAIAADLQEAGFSDVTIVEVPLENEIPSAEEFAYGLVHGGPAIDAIKERGNVSQEEATSTVANAIATAFGDPGKMLLNAIVVEARKE